MGGNSKELLLLSDLIVAYNMIGLSSSYYYILGRVLIFYTDVICTLGDTCTECRYVREYKTVASYG